MNASDFNSRSLLERIVDALLPVSRGSLREQSVVVDDQGILIARLRAELSEAQRNIVRIEALLAGIPNARPPGAGRIVSQAPSPVVAVVMPTFNRAGFVTEAIDSVIAQTFTRWELALIDDGSTDDTGSAIAPYLNDPRIRYIKQDNAGAARARNRGLAETSAPLIAYLDSDNLWYPDFLSRAVDCMAAEPEVDLLYGALVYEDRPKPGGGGRESCILWRDFDRAILLQGNYIDTNVIVHRRALIAKYGEWDPAVPRLDDWDLVLRYTVDKPARPLNVLAAYYRICDDLRLSDRLDHGVDEEAIKNKWKPNDTANGA